MAGKGRRWENGMGLLAEVSVAVSHLSKDNPVRWGSSEYGDEM